MIINNLHIGVFFIVTGILFAIISKKIRPYWAILIPILGLSLGLYLPSGASGQGSVLGYTLTFIYLDHTSRLFLIVFCFALFAGSLYCCLQAKWQELTVAFIYAGAAIGVVLAGDWISLFIFWELMAFASLSLIWLANGVAAKEAGMRYILVHLLGGVLLMIGIISHIQHTQTVVLERLTLGDPGSWFILAGILLNAGAPPFSAWLADAYPESSPWGMVFLSAFTTKSAVYLLLRTFPGTDILVWVGLYMIFYGIIYALLENDIRRILAYSIVNQVGFMVCGVGIGTHLALDGVAAHAFTHIIYKALLLMSAGAVLYRTSLRKCTDLGGLIYSMKWTACFGIIGALAISSFPLTSGFISKSMITQASVEGHLLWVWLLLQAASAGVFLHAGIKFPWFVFFQKDSGLRPRDPPWNMCLAMGILSAICLLLGIFPKYLYQLLPYQSMYEPYTSAHVLTQLQLLLFSGLAFFVMLPWMQRTLTVSLDIDWFYRRLLVDLFGVCACYFKQCQQGLMTILSPFRTMFSPSEHRSLDEYPTGHLLLIIIVFFMLLLGFLLWGSLLL